MSKKIVIEKNNKKVTSRNYFIVLVVTILIIILTLYVRSFIINYKNNKANTSIFKDNIQSVQFSDLEYTIPETGEAILYVSYTGNSKINSMEKKLYYNIEKKGLKDKIIYLDITDKLNNMEYIKLLKDKFPEVDGEINTAPLFIYINDGKAVEAMSSELKMVDYNIANKIIEKYEVE